jgi:hypothetical protein
LQSGQKCVIFSIIRVLLLCLHDFSDVLNGKLNSFSLWLLEQRVGSAATTSIHVQSPI